MKLKTFIQATNNAATAVAWVANDRLLAGGYNKLASVFDANTGQTVRSITFPAGVECAASDGGVGYLGLANGFVVNTEQPGFDSEIGRLVEIAISNDRIAVAGSKIENGMTICRVAVFSLNGTLVWSQITTSIAYGLAFSPDGAMLYHSSGAQLYRRNVITGDNLVPPRPAATSRITDLAASGSEVAVAQENSGGVSSSLHYCSDASLTEIGSCPLQFKSGIWAVSYSPDGTRIAVAEVGDQVADTHRVAVIERSSGLMLYSHSRTGVVPKDIAFHPLRNDLFSAAWADGLVELYDLQPDPVAPAPPPSTPVTRPGKHHK